MSTFYDFQFNQAVLDGLDSMGFDTPTPIQQEAIPLVVAGHDVIACAQTGTGKTAAFAIPILQMLHGKVEKHKSHIKTLILTPTRELAIQIGESFSAY